MVYYTSRLKEIRKYRELSQIDIAKKLHISQQHYSMYETGKRILNAEQIISFCKLCNISADYLLGLTDDFKTLSKE